MQTHSFLNKDLKLFIPFGCVIAGPSTSGKSTIVQKIIQQADQIIEPSPRSIAYFYGEYNSLVPLLQKIGVQVKAGVPSEDDIKLLEKPSLLILDDLLYSVESKYLSELFTKKAHHLNFGIIFIAQDIFDKKLKTARQNSQYIFLTRAPSSALSIRNLGVQLFPGPGRLAFFLDAYRQATREKYSYLFIDLHPASDPILRLRNNILGEEELASVYLPKNG
jgi:hypothetical protein